MQRGCMQRNSRKQDPDVWQFRWSEASPDGKRLYHKKICPIRMEGLPDRKLRVAEKEHKKGAKRALFLP
jgi:hypothetical protein